MRPLLRNTTLLCALACVAAAGCLPAQGASKCDPGNAGLTLAPGFCATLFASVPGARHIAVTSAGDVFVAASGRSGGLFLLHDRDGDGHADTTVSFATGSFTGVAVSGDAVFYAPADQVLRIPYRAGTLAPGGPASVVVSGLPTGGHSAKTLALGKDGSLFVDHGSATNSCQVEDRKERSPGQQPCAELAVRAGIWRYDSRKSNQTPADGERWATGLRNAMAIAVEPTTGVLFGASHGRDQLSANWGFSDQDNAEKPSEEFAMITKGTDLGWPYCYYDPIAKRKVQAPEYGGDGIKVGECGQKTQPLIGFPGHWAPLALTFYNGTAFGPAFRTGAFLAFHGSWNRAPLPQAGYRVVFIPFRDGKPVGTYQTFATGSGSETSVRPSGVAVAPGGAALYVASDASGKVWRIIPTPK
ncbi:MAG: PQQ-dependent sugar dehydrogenase [Gemmatimonadota bacterium]